MVMRLAAAICLILGLLLAPVFGAVDRWIVVRVDGDRFFLGDTIVLDIDSTGLEDPIDFSALDKIANIGRQTAGTRIAVIGGKVVEIKSLRLEITPKAAGHVTIGPLTAGGVSSNTIVIDVEAERPPQWIPTAEDADMTMTVSTPQPWLHQELLLDIRVRHRHPLSDDEVRLPVLGDFRVTPVFEERRTIETSDGGWAVLAWRYLIYPQHSGLITIGAPHLDATLSRTRIERARIELAANPIQLDVRPAASPAQWWLPARNVAMKDQWSVEPTGLSAGDEVVRTITVEADGVRPEQIPDIVMPETRGFQITPAGVRRSGSTDDTGSKATASFDFKLRAVSPVAIFVDTVRLPWWDTGKGVAKNAIIPARRIEIGMPDREKLIENAGGDRLADRMPALGWPVLAAAGLAAIMAALALFLTRRKRTTDPVRVLLTAAASRMRRGDANGAIEILRQLPLNHRLWPSVAKIRLEIEKGLTTGEPVQRPDALAAEIKKLRGATRRPEGMAALPEL